MLDENWPQRLVLGVARPLHHRPQHLLPSQGHHDPQVAYTLKQSPKTSIFFVPPLWPTQFSKLIRFLKISL